MHNLFLPQAALAITCNCSTLHHYYCTVATRSQSEVLGIMRFVSPAAAREPRQAATCNSTIPAVSCSDFSKYPLPRKWGKKGVQSKIKSRILASG